ncbi:MAG: 23S rRNA pseudouridine1911/1915/1917 synthase [Flavobacteriaceae bacterium]|jgi:23S rRNA pseudouridine1911/1915/1917 synthase
MIELEKHLVAEVDEHTRFIDYVVGLFPQVMTRSAVKKAIKKGEFLHNGVIADTRIWVTVGDAIMLVDQQNQPPKPFPLDIEVVMEDEYCAVVYKPSGLVVSGNQHRTLVNALVDELTLSNQPDAYKWGKPVHRLDSATSGLVIVAKTAHAHGGFGKLFESREIRKTYVAIVQGEVKDQEIELEIGGKPAQTQLKVLESVRSLRNEVLTLIELTPKSGRTHQLRIHCASIGHPIVGDKLYGIEGEIMNHKGLFLCAQKLQFLHPISTELTEVAIPIPNKFNALLKQEERRWTAKNAL